MMSKVLYTLRWMIIFSVIISVISCGSFVKLLVGTPKLNVYSQQEIDNNINLLSKKNNVIDAQLITALETSDIKKFIFNSVSFQPYVYNKNNTLLCYKGEFLCGIPQLDSLKTGTIEESYVVCDSSKKEIDIDQYLGDFNDIAKKINIPDSIDLNSFQHKVIMFMNTDIAKDGIKDNWQYVYNSLNHNNPNTIFIRIWTDLNEEWGLKYGAKARFKVRRVKGTLKEYEMTLPKLPYKKTNKNLEK